jgi:hypothetical protein
MAQRTVYGQEKPSKKKYVCLVHGASLLAKKERKKITEQHRNISFCFFKVHCHASAAMLKIYPPAAEKR